MSLKTENFLRTEVALEVTQHIIDLFSKYRVFFSPDYSNRLQIGEHLFFEKTLNMEPYVGLLSGTSIPHLGAFTYSWSSLPSKLIVGRYTSIAGGLRIPGPRHPIESVTTSPIAYDRNFCIVDAAMKDAGKNKFQDVPIPQKSLPIIGHDVWIGSDVVLMPGIKIGNGSIVAANAVVTKNVPAYAIVGGNPAKIIKYRFNDDIIKRFNRVKWWQYNFTELDNIPMKCPVEFLDNFEKNFENIKKWKPRRLNLWREIKKDQA